MYLYMVLKLLLIVRASDEKRVTIKMTINNLEGLRSLSQNDLDNV